MRRLTAKGSGNWPIAFQDHRYDKQIRGYELASITPWNSSTRARCRTRPFLV